MSDTIVIIPTYNESENIEALISTVFSLPNPFHILVVDDNSPDGTAALVEKMQLSFPQQLHLLNRASKNGLGTAYIEGFKWCLKNSYNYIFEMDADFSHNPEDLPRLHQILINDNADVAIGSRYIKGVNVVNWPLARVLLSYGASIYVKIITGMKIQDPTAGFVCYKRSVLETINLDNVRFIGYAFQIEMKFKAYKKGFRLMEIPIIFTDRTKGKSKMSSGIISEAIFGVIIMKCKSLFKGKEKLNE